MSDAASQRIDELENRLAFLDDTVEQLNSVIARQDRDIGLMQQQLSELIAKLADLGGSGGEDSGGSQHEIPPHY
jgi:SlyX protein